MAKVTLNDITDAPGFSTTVNANQDLVETAIENTLSRDGTGPNAMAANLDMNSNRILNVPNAVNNQEPVVLGQAAAILDISSTALTQNNLGDTLWPITTAETASGLVETDLTNHYSPGNMLRYGANPDGATDNQDAFTKASLQLLETDGANLVIPPGSYMMLSQWVLRAPDFNRSSVWGYGAEIKTTGAISGVEIVGGSTTGGILVAGLQVNARGNATQTAGFDIVGKSADLVSGTSNVHLMDCSVEAHDTHATYACFRLRNRTSGQQDNPFFTLIDHCHVRRRGSGDGAQFQYGILSIGSNNATTIRDCNLTGVVVLKFENDPGNTFMANNVLIDGNHFEGYTTAYEVDSDTASTNFAGHRITNNRFENGTNLFVLTGTNLTSSQHLFIGHNGYVSDAGTYLTDANDVGVNSWEFSTTPDGRTDVMFHGPLTFYRTDAGDALVLQAIQDAGFHLENAGGSTTVAEFINRGGGTAALKGPSEIWCSNIRSISASATEANNLRGTVTMTGGTATVTFGTAEPDATYFLTFSSDTAGDISWSNKIAASFDITHSGGGTEVVHWHLIR